jgi:transcriptional regulator with PAS, ATPase and Fis domain
VEYFLNSFRKRYAKDITTVSDSCKRLLFQHSWPGNIRELKNVLERAFIVCENSMIDEHDIIFEASHHQSDKKDLKSLMNAYEKNILIQALAKNNGNRTKTADELDISLRNLQYKLSKYNITE